MRHARIFAAALAAALCALAVPAGAQVSTTPSIVWGQGGSFTTNTSNNGGIGAATLYHPEGLTLDSSGNLYVADQVNNRVLFYAAGSTTATQVYGQGASFANGTAENGGISASSLSGPTGVALDANGNLYVADHTNNRVLYFPAGSTTATQVYGQAGSFTTNMANRGGSGSNPTAASLSSPTEVAVDSSGNLYVADFGNSRVLYYAAGSTTASQVYGQGGSFTTNTANKGGTGAASLSHPAGVALDSSGNLYVADFGNSRVLYYAAGSTTASQVYGQGGSFTTGSLNNGGSPGAATLSNPSAVAVDSSGNLYVGDSANNRVLYYAAGSTTATQVYGQSGSFTSNSANGGYAVSAAGLNHPYVAVDSSGNLYVGDSGNNRLLEFFTLAVLSVSATHSPSIFQAGPGSITLTIAISGGVTAAAATVTDTLTTDFTINSASSGCSVSGQTVTCTLAAGSSAASTSFTIYVTASSTAASSISNTAALADATDTIAAASATDTIAVATEAPQVDSSLSQTLLSGSTDNGTCAGGNMTLTATDLLQNIGGSTLTNPYAVIGTLSQGNSLLSQSASSASVGPGANVTFTFHIQLANCNTFRLIFDVRSN